MGPSLASASHKSTAACCCKSVLLRLLCEPASQAWAGLHYPLFFFFFFFGLKKKWNLQQPQMIWFVNNTNALSFRENLLGLLGPMVSALIDGTCHLLRGAFPDRPPGAVFIRLRPASLDHSALLCWGHLQPWLRCGSRCPKCHIATRGESHDYYILNPPWGPYRNILKKFEKKWLLEFVVLLYDLICASWAGPIQR